MRTDSRTVDALAPRVAAYSAMPLAPAHSARFGRSVRADARLQRVIPPPMRHCLAGTDLADLLFVR